MFASLFCAFPKTTQTQIFVKEENSLVKLGIEDNLAKLQFEIDHQLFKDQFLQLKINFFKLLEINSLIFLKISK